MSATATLRLAMRDAATAQAAIAPDDEGYLTTRLDDGVLVLEAEGRTTLGLLRTLDDALACLRALEDD